MSSENNAPISHPVCVTAPGLLAISGYSPAQPLCSEKTDKRGLGEKKEEIYAFKENYFWQSNIKLYSETKQIFQCNTDAVSEGDIISPADVSQTMIAAAPLLESPGASWG